MIPLYTQDEFNNSKSEDKLQCQCEICSNIFYKSKRDILKVLRGKRVGKYCSKTCVGVSRIKKQIIICANCNKEFNQRPFEIRKSKSDNHFCSSSCAAQYNNTHKTKGYCRSKLEKYLEIELIKSCSNLEILFNDKKAINSELDIYVPSLKLAFELNGIFHYEPIFGQNTLNKIQNNDNHKFRACIEHNIDLCIIDTSQQKYFKIETSQKYLDIIINIIKERLSTF
jgi:hypothetical protein